MKILGIDPGFDRLGLAVVEGDPSKPVVLWSGCVEPKEGVMADRLAAVYTAIQETIVTHTPDAIAIEKLFFSTNRKTALKVSEARGAILSAAGSAHLPVLEFSPQQVKLAVTGHGAADKAAIARMIPKLVALTPKKRRDDELDAIAVALAGLSSRRGGAPLA